jgi:hypothetical protein
LYSAKCVTEVAVERLRGQLTERPTDRARPNSTTLRSSVFNTGVVPAIERATEAPTFPAPPTTVTFLFIESPVSGFGL